MAYHTTIFSQVLKLVPRLEFERLANQQDGRRRSDALTRWSQFIALTVGQLAGRTSLRDIEATLHSIAIILGHRPSAARHWRGPMNRWTVLFIYPCSANCTSGAHHHAPCHGFPLQ